MLFTNPELKSIFEQPPMVANRQPPSLRKLLCSSSLSKISPSGRPKRGANINAPGWKKCNKPCPICPLALPPCKSITSLVANYTHEIKEPLNCQTQNCLYYWRCIKDNCKLYPQCEYVGMTSRKYQIRMSEHRDYVKSDNTCEPCGEHFNLPGHSVHHLQGMVLEQVKSKDPFVLRARESMLIKKMDTYHRGLNKEPLGSECC